MHSVKRLCLSRKALFVAMLISSLRNLHPFRSLESPSTCVTGSVRLPFGGKVTQPTNIMQTSLHLTLSAIWHSESLVVAWKMECSTHGSRLSHRRSRPELMSRPLDGCSKQEARCRSFCASWFRAILERNVTVILNWAARSVLSKILNWWLFGA